LTELAAHSKRMHQPGIKRLRKIGKHVNICPTRIEPTS
jgi:hypothetical protein